MPAPGVRQLLCLTRWHKMTPGHQDFIVRKALENGMYEPFTADELRVANNIVENALQIENIPPWKDDVVPRLLATVAILQTRIDAMPLGDFAARIVRNLEYRVLVDAIIAQGGNLSLLVSAVNSHRYKISEDELTTERQPH